MLERQYKYKVEIREFTASVQREQLVPALREVSFSATSRSYDLRTAVLLYDKSGKRMLSLYFDRSGRNGVVNRDSVSTNDAVYRWARSMMRGFASAIWFGYEQEQHVGFDPLTRGRFCPSHPTCPAARRQAPRGSCGLSTRILALRRRGRGFGWSGGIVIEQLVQ